jgi:hypothetical protein
LTERQNNNGANPEILTVFDFLAGTNLRVGFSALKLAHLEEDDR